jgi:hypothetical protein
VELFLVFMIIMAFCVYWWLEDFIFTWVGTSMLYYGDENHLEGGA